MEPGCSLRAPGARNCWCWLSNHYSTATCHGWCCLAAPRGRAGPDGRRGPRRGGPGVGLCGITAGIAPGFVRIPSRKVCARRRRDSAKIPKPLAVFHLPFGRPVIWRPGLRGYPRLIRDRRVARPCPILPEPRIQPFRCRPERGVTMVRVRHKNVPTREGAGAPTCLSASDGSPDRASGARDSILPALRRDADAHDPLQKNSHGPHCVPVPPPTLRLHARVPPRARTRRTPPLMRVFSPPRTGADRPEAVLPRSARSERGGGGGRGPAQAVARQRIAVRRDEVCGFVRVAAELRRGTRRRTDAPKDRRSRIIRPGAGEQGAGGVRCVQPCRAAFGRGRRKDAVDRRSLADYDTDRSTKTIPSSCSHAPVTRADP